jgi:branched-chain amino acid transport system ATP-binding protein
MTLVMDVCETIHVLDYGKAIAAGTPEDIRTNQAVVDAYLGTPEGVG